MMKVLLTLLLFLALSVGAGAQEKKYESDFVGVTQNELDLVKYDKDTTARAVYLNEYGLSLIEERSDDQIKLNMYYHAKIKILNNNGFADGTIQIPVYSTDEISEEVTNITGTTYYKDDDGQTRRVRLDPKQVFTVKNNKYYNTIKFTMPALRPGCIIEISYKFISPFLETFRQWNFQDNIPKISSTYEAYIPYLYHYNAALRGTLKLSTSTSEPLRDYFNFSGIKCWAAHNIYKMDDIPAFVSEDYISSPNNYLAAIYFELAEFTSPYGGKHTIISKEWKDIDYQLSTSTDFGWYLKHKDDLKAKMVVVTAGKTDELDKAKAIYTYLQKWYKWNDYRGIFSTTGIKKAMNAHTGSVADINLTLAAALMAADITTETVLLSTRDHGSVNTVYPVLTEFNYVVVKATIGNRSYLLDATDPLLSFGLLPLICLNDKGRVISLDKPSYWIDLSAIQKTSNSRSLNLTLLNDGRITGTLINVYGGYGAYEKRREIKKFNSFDEYVEDMDEKLPKLKILKSSIVNLDSLNQPLSETFEVEMEALDKQQQDRLLFNPFLWNKITSNPFKLAERNYPVDWGMASDSRMSVNMQLPAGYVIETPPQAVSFSLPDNGGLFATTYESNDTGFAFSNITRFTRSIYSTDEYPYLKEFYNKMILTEKADMVFKKK